MGGHFPRTKSGFAPIPAPSSQSHGSSFLGQLELLGKAELNKLALEDLSEVRPGWRSDSFGYCV